MNKNILIFACTFIAGAFITLGIRTARHDPNASSGNVPSAIAPTTVPEVPATNHEHAAMTPAADNTPVNTVCAICGMDVDPDLTTMTYKGKVIGFGCKNCLPKFAAEPDVYGPAALENRVVE